MRPRVPVIKTPDWERSAANAINLLLGDIPEGGTTAQALVKASTDDFDMEWATVASGAHVHAAADVTFAPAGSIAAANVQAAIVELDTEKAAASHSHVIGDVTGLQAAIDLKLDIASYTAADVLTKLLTVDGPGSGLDADLLGGQTGSYYLDRANHTGTATDLTVSGLFRLSGAGDVTLASIDHPFQIGADAGFNLAVDRNELQTRNSGAASEMHLNQSGGTVYVGHDHSTDASISSTAHHLQVGPTTGLNLRFDGNEILAVNNGATSTLFLNNDGGSPVSVGTGGLTVQGGTLTLNTNVAISFAGTGAATTRTNLGLGTAATQNTGTSGANVPLLNGINTWSGQQNFTAGLNVNAATPIVTFNDNDTAGTGARGYFQMRDSANVQSWRVGKVSSNNIEIDNATGDSIVLSRAGTAKLTIDGLNNRIDIAAGVVVRINSLQILGARKTGWATATGTATRTTFDTATVTLPQLAERVKALIDDLHNTAGHGLIGT